MRNSKGSILAITVGFALVFTMLGIASIYIGILQSETQEKQILSQKAFWLAEAGIQQAFSLLPNTLFNPPERITLGDGEYDVTTEVKSGYINNRWIIKSKGFVASAIREIQAEVGANVIDAFQTTGTLKPGSKDQITGTYSEDNDPFVFFDIFHKTSAEIKAMAQLLTNPSNNQNITDDDNDLEDGIIWVDGDFKVTSDWDYKGILIINGNFEMTGGSFQGIVWVEGAAKMIEGNPGINGAVFVNDPKNGQTKIDSSSAWIIYDGQAIDEAFGYYSGGAPPDVFHHLINWKEVDPE